MALITASLGFNWSNGGADLFNSVSFSTSGHDRRNVYLPGSGARSYVPLRFPIGALKYFYALTDADCIFEMNTADKGMQRLEANKPFFWYRGCGQELSAIDGFGDLDGAANHQILYFSGGVPANIQVRVGFMATLQAFVSDNISTFTDGSSVGTVAWSNPTNAASSNNSYATASIDATTTHYLQGVGHDFDGNLIDATNYTPTGMSVILEAKSPSADTITVYPVIAGVVQSSNPLTLVSGTLGSSDSDLLYGGEFDFGGLSPTAAAINSSLNAGTFGVAVKVVGAGGGAHTFSVDTVRALTLYSGY